MIDVLVVDDSALVRQMLTALLSRIPGVRVRVAFDPLFAQAKIREARPDVVVLDLEMPRMDGLTLLRWIMERDPLPVVICSSLAAAGTQNALRALELGAVDLIEKPRLGIRDFLEESADAITDAVLAAATARVVRAPRLPIARVDAPLPVTTEKVIAIGASTGGTEALRQLLGAVPAHAPGIVVVQHMPQGFTAAFAKSLNEHCAIEVLEAQGGERVGPGRALIAPGNRHMRVVRSGAQYHVAINDGERVSRHRPSVDVLFESVAAAAGANAIGVLLTGMSGDGANGLLAMRNAGARTIAQDEATSVVFGMARDAIAAGAVEQVLPLPHIARSLY